MTAHRYKLQFDNGPDQFVEAEGSVKAVLARVGERQPHTITDLTVMREWVEKPWGTGHPTPLRDRTMGRFDKDAPRYLPAKELA